MNIRDPKKYIRTPKPKTPKPGHLLGEPNSKTINEAAGILATNIGCGLALILALTGMGLGVAVGIVMAVVHYLPIVFGW